ncbi:hypothetical protein [Pseudoteredinibacter isoporae]|uniref:Uncharacterized protein n=1 Tax=Pseudoteredinibacter isoporae TaxID=570281 RepID=A0A7X0MVM8_9GAMM|nr:hypothetical protein [Pseudoteredinibacter isoporae]MBB6521881.1 hypothetical protein [Pseudoteredinibacter isoporae]NHO87425.1 hypothetical protein [Pseudoteredinibacter isoporae]NIB24244.1 hypothetical protein [Pseudoteredinibacter isoporae]
MSNVNLQKNSFFRRNIIATRIIGAWLTAILLLIQVTALAANGCSPISNSSQESSYLFPDYESTDGCSGSEHHPETDEKTPSIKESGCDSCLCTVMEVSCSTLPIAESLPSIDGSSNGKIPHTNRAVPQAWLKGPFRPPLNELLR